MKHWASHLLAASTALLSSATNVAAAPSASEDSTTVSLAPKTSRWPSGLHLSVDYYPSQWPRSVWDSDMASMAANNISFIRISEFDWAVLEPQEGVYNWTMLDESLAAAQKHGLRAIVGTPTATPPNWAVNKYQLNYVDRTNATLIFGSRRHYSFSSFDYRTLSKGITEQLAQRYGDHEAVVGWQLDNEFGCHDTVRTYDVDAITRFRDWLKEKYGTIDAMNKAQGRVFWSEDYESFDVVQPPFMEVYTTNELHTQDWYEFSSDMVVDFAKDQVEILRKYSPDKAITTNFMVGFTDFDHWKFARETGIDLATFDSYALAGPSGFPWLSDEELAATLRTGLPDVQALMHGVYRGVAGAAFESDNKTSGLFGVMEMQPGVLNWNQYRVSPWDGMVRLWTLETFAASGDMVSYFRWRQVPFAQEQTLSGLHTSDYEPDVGMMEMQDVVANDLPKLRELLDSSDSDSVVEEPKADVAFVWDYTASWTWAIEPYSGVWDVKSAGYTGAVVSYLDLVYLFYSAVRRLGLSVDIVSPDTSLEGYKMVVVPSMPIIPDSFDASLRAFSGPVVFGPHTGSKTAQFATVPGLNPGKTGALSDRLPMRISRVETPPSYAGSGVAYAGTNYTIWGREEWIECARGNATSEATVTYTSPHRPAGKAAACQKDGAHYLAFRPEVDMLVAYLGDVASDAGLEDLVGNEVSKKNDLGATLRLLRRGKLLFAFNYGTEAVTLPDSLAGLSKSGKGEMVIGDVEAGDVPAAGVLVWKMV